MSRHKVVGVSLCLCVLRSWLILVAVARFLAIVRSSRSPLAVARALARRRPIGSFRCWRLRPFTRPPAFGAHPAIGRNGLRDGQIELLGSCRSWIALSLPGFPFGLLFHVIDGYCRVLFIGNVLLHHDRICEVGPLLFRTLAVEGNPALPAPPAKHRIDSCLRHDHLHRW